MEIVGARGGMRLVVAGTYAAMSQLAAEAVANALRANPDAAIVLPTGATPQRFYAEMVALHAQGAFDTTRLRVFQLDEYVGLPEGDPRAFYGWLRRAILDPLGVAEARVTRLRGDAADLAAACHAYDDAVRAAGGFDLAVLGLGRNGHLGFNEPPADPASLARAVTLSAGTIAANARYWGPDLPPPTRAVTCGMAALLAARQKIVLVSGVTKRDILRRVIEEPASAQAPASLLQSSAGVTIYADAGAWPWPRAATAGAQGELDKRGV